MTSTLTVVFTVLCGFAAVDLARSAHATHAPNPCPHGGWWPVGTGASAQCFHLWSNRMKNFVDAQAFCHQKGGYLASDTSTAVHNALKTYILRAGTSGTKPSSFWLGLTDWNQDKAWTWVGTNQTLGRFKQWNGGHQPGIADHKMDCIYVNSNDRNMKWRGTNNCNAIRAVVCQRKAGTPAPVTTPRPHISCDSGWTLYSRTPTCIRLHTTLRVWPDARTNCQQDGGDLVKITDTRMSGWINSKVNAQKGNYWIGLHDRHQENKFEWLDETTAAKYTYWASHQPDNGGGKENCVELHQGFQYKWNDANCNAKLRYICQKPPKQMTGPVTQASTPGSRNCGAGWEDDPNTDSCYQLNDDSLTWMDARQTCQSRGGDLASVNTIQESYYLSARTISFQSNLFWIGANDMSQESGYVWANKQPMGFLNWAPGQPNNAHNSDCVAMIQSSGRWNDLPCQNRAGFICEKKGHTTSPTPRPTTSPKNTPKDKMWGCGLGWRGFRGSCYLVLTAPSGFDYPTARSACGNYQGTLTSIVDGPENRFVFSMLPNTQNQYAWTGFNDQLMENSFQWSDSERVTYTNWNPHEPNNQHNEDCVVMLTKTGKWVDVQCSSKKKYMVCKQPKRYHAKSEQDIVKGCPTGIGFGARCYTWYYTPAKNWNAAKAFCASKSHGHLATISDRHIQAFIGAEMSSKPGSAYWVGLQYTAATHYNYIWSTNHMNLTFSNWDKAHTGNENNTCVGMSTTVPVGMWKNYPCTQSLPYICENNRRGFTTPKPTTTTTVKLLCPTGWQTYRNLCVKAFTRDINSTLTWTDSRDYCAALWPGGTLVSIRTRGFENWMKNRVVKHLTGNYWIGLSDRGLEGGYKWEDAAPLRYTNWMTNQPDDNSGNEDCVQWNLDAGKWNDATCYTNWNFICQVPKGAVVTTPAPPPKGVTTLQCGNSSWTEYKQFCYFVSPDNGELKTWFEANLQCQDLGGNLVSIANDDENAFVTGQLSRSTNNNFWIGLNDLDGRMVWPDGAPVTYVSWSNGEPNDAYGSERCVEMTAFSSWNDEHCQEKRGYVCKKRPGDFSTPHRTSPSTKGGCAPGWHTLPGFSKCYFIGGVDPRGRGRKNYTDAQKMCSQYSNSRLASIHSSQEEKFITVLLANNHLRWPAWMGFNDQKKNNNFMWVDNSLADYTLWGPRQPDENVKDTRAVARRDCVDMEVGRTNAGSWYDKRCQDRYSYVCELTKNVIYPTESTNTTGCKAGFTRFRDSCYQYQNELYTWDQANTFCGTQGGTLVSIQDKFEMYFVELLTPPKSSSDLMIWLGLHFVQSDARYEWADTWPVQYTYWGHGEPDRQANEGCVSHTKDGQWQDVPCQMQMSFVCENNLKPAPTVKTPPTAKCTRPWTGWTDFCYYTERTNAKNWAGARYACNIKGGNLVSVHSDEEAKFVTNLVTRTARKDTWLGLALGQNLGFSWADGTPVNYLYWAQGEPSDSDSTMHQDCVAARRQDGSWRDTDCGDLHLYICKKELYVGRSTTAVTYNPNAVMTRDDRGSNPPPTAGAITQAPGKPITQAPITQAPWTPKPGQPGRPTQAPYTYPPYNPNNTPSPQKQAGGPIGSTGMSEGSIVGVVLGTIAIIAIAAVLIFFLKGRVNFPARFGNSGGGQPGFDNATYNTGDEQVKIQSDA